MGTPMLAGMLEQRLGQLPCLILRRVKSPKVVADDLIRQVALGAHGTRIPRDHIPFGIEQEDRVVLNILHQEPELLFTPPQTLFHILPFRQVTRYFRKPAKLSSNTIPQ